MVEAEKATKMQAKKIGKGKRKTVYYQARSERDIEEEASDESESKIGDCIIIDNE